MNSLIGILTTHNVINWLKFDRPRYSAVVPDYSHQKTNSIIGIELVMYHIYLGRVTVN